MDAREEELREEESKEGRKKRSDKGRRNNEETPRSDLISCTLSPMTLSMKYNISFNLLESVHDIYLANLNAGAQTSRSSSGDHDEGWIGAGHTTRR